MKNVSYAYKSQKEKEILKNVSMQFEEKKFYTIVGASGTGKTTFKSLLAIKFSQNFSTHLLTVLIRYVILQLEQNKSNDSTKEKPAFALA